MIVIAYLDRPTWMREIYELEIPDGLSPAQQLDKVEQFLLQDPCTPGVSELKATTPGYLRDVQFLKSVVTVKA